MPGPWEEYQTSAPQGAPSVIPLPQTPSAVRDEQRDNRRLDITGENLNISKRGEVRSDERQGFDFEKDLRKEFTNLPAVKEYQTVVRQLATALKTRSTPTGDQALITAYAKMLDPGSVVREQEFNTVAAGDSSVGQSIARIQKELGVDDAGMLRPEVRGRLRMEMLNLTRGYNKSYNQARKHYSITAEAHGVKPDLVVGEHLAKPYQETVRAWAKKESAGQLNLASGGDTNKSIPIPDAMQTEHREWVSQRQGRIDPQDYSAFRSHLDNKYGFAPRPQEYEQFIRDNPDFSSGDIPPVDAKMTGQDKLNASVFNNQAGAAALSAPILAPFSDEIAGGVRSLMNGTDYGVERDSANAMRQQAAGQYPLASLAGALGGGLGLGGITAKMAPRLADITSRTVPRALAAGAGYGAVSGAGENNDDRAAGLGMGALVGAAGAGMGAAASPMIERLARTAPAQKIAQGVSAMTGRPFQRAPVMSRMDNAVSAVDGIRGNITEAQRLGLPYSLADASAQTRALAGSAARFSPKARELAENTYAPRADERSERAINTVREKLSPTADTAARRQELFAAGSVESSPLYEEVFARAAPISGEVDAILQTKTGKQALKEARAIAENEGFDPKGIGFDLDGQGEVVLSQKPTFRALDLVKRGLDSMIEGNRNPVTGNLDTTGNPGLRALDTLRGRLRNELDRIEPKYKDARGAYEKYAKQADALDRGYKAPGQQVMPRDMERGLLGLDDDSLLEYRRGYATRVTDDIAKKERGDPYESFYGKPGSTTSQRREKVGRLFPEATSDLDSITRLERDMDRTYQEVLGGSPTQPRRVADEQFADRIGEAGANAAIDLAGGAGLASGVGAARNYLRSRNNLGLLGAERKAEEIAPTLMDTSNPRGLLDYLDGLDEKQREIIRRRLQYKQTGGMMGGLLGAGLIPATE